METGTRIESKSMQKIETKLYLPSEETYRKAGELLRGGELVAFPTETVYGLGADALNAEAVLRIFQAKNRPADNPLIVHIWDRSQLDALCETTDTARRLMDAFWPGPLTLLCRKKPAVPDAVTAGLPTVGMRMPSHPVAQAMLKAAGVPVAAPSANLSTRPSPTTARDVYEDMQGRVPMIIDGGACEFGVESTVLDLSGDVPVILRPGAVTREMIRDTVGACEVADSVMRPLKEGEAAPSPGMKHRHYAPKGRLTIYRGSAPAVAREIRRAYAQAERPVVLVTTPHAGLFEGLDCLDMGPSLLDAAHNLFACLREADRRGYDRLLAEAVSEEAVGLAVMNRMARAAAFDVVDVDDEPGEA